MSKITRILALLGACAYVVAIALTMLDITLRSVSASTVGGVIDLTQLCVMAGAMLAIPYGFIVDQHVSVELFVEKLPTQIQLVLRIFGTLLASAFLSGVFWFSLQQALIENAGGDRSQTIGVPMLWYWLPFVAGIGLSVVTTLTIAWDLFRNGLPQRANGPEAAQ